MKRKVLSLLMAALMVLLAACASGEPAATEAPAPVETKTPQVQPIEQAGLVDGTYTGEGTGNNGAVKVEVKISGGAIASVEVTEHVETKGLGDVAMEKLAKLMAENNSPHVDTVTGATMSSNALITATLAALKEAGATDEMIAAMGKADTGANALSDSYTYDVVVVGAGGGGLAAALTAANAGAKVALLEKTAFPGGNTLVSGGGLNVPGSHLQIEQGIEDSVEKFEEDTFTQGDSRADRALVKVMAENALDALTWLIDDIGVEFMPDRLQQFGGHSAPRALVPVGNKGDELINKLKTAADQAGVDFYPETRATELIADKNKVTGVLAQNGGKSVTFEANKGVVLTTGGFGANLEMRKKYNAEYDEKYKTTCTPASTGDGMIMAEKIGAQLIDMELIQVYPTCSPVTGIISYVANSRFDGAILVNQEGERFVDEMGRRDVISNAIVSQTGEVGYLFWGAEVESVGNMVTLHSVEYAAMEKDGVIYKASSIEDAANHYGIDPAKLIESIDRFNEFVEKGADEDFNKGGTLRAIKEGPFYIQKTTPSTHHTMGGIKINTEAQVINTSGEVIENLYAAGEVTGGVHGTNRLGGNAITDIIVFGRIAGENASK
ncbi:flavocytochrome c [Christensenellaceae bacterium OttesenSCG-928-M15]|nr:flavocytochrome c [Christensenellaceae bacterium OttesenSCG-928-M15]